MGIGTGETAKLDCVLIPVVRVGGGVGWGKPLYKAVDFCGVEPECGWEGDVYLECISTLV